MFLTRRLLSVLLSRIALARGMCSIHEVRRDRSRIIEGGPANEAILEVNQSILVLRKPEEG